MSSYCPKRGDVACISLDPQVGHEQAGFRPALAVSPEIYNSKVGLALLCPITSQVKGYPFEVSIPPGLKVSGVILSDQLKSLDWKACSTSFLCSIPHNVVVHVLNKVGAILVA